MKIVHKLTPEENSELRRFKYVENGDELYWQRLSEIYKDEPEVIEKIKFFEGYLYSVKSIPFNYGSYQKTLNSYLSSVDKFNKEIGYVSESDEKPPYEDNLLEKIAEKLGINIDINGDGYTSFDKYRGGDVSENSKI